MKTRKNSIKANPKDFALICVVLLILISYCAWMCSAEMKKKVVIYFFYGEGCPHCAKEKQFLENLKANYTEVEIKTFETWYNEENAKLFVKMAEAYETKAQGVPTTFIGDKYWVGYADYIGTQIENYVKYCIENECADPGEKLNTKKQICIHVFYIGTCPQCQRAVSYIDYLVEKYSIDINKHDVSFDDEKNLYEKFKENYGVISAAYPIVFIGKKMLIGESAIKENLEQEIVSCIESGCECPTEKIQGPIPYTPLPSDVTPEENGEIELPILGKIDSSKISLPLFTIIIASLDSFNPCAFFVLFFLLSMLVYAQSRKRMLLIGGTFVFFSAFIYFLFMAAWLNLFLFIGQLMIITTIAGIIALIVALINIKDFFFFKKGISLMIPEKVKPKLFERMRKLIKASSIPSMMIGTIVLAIAANTYELLCTAGFPMVFTRVLTLHQLSILEYYLYLVFYNIIYVIPLLAIVLMFTLTLGAKKLTEYQGQVLKLISGLMMLCLGLVLLINPSLLNNVFLSFGLLAIALVSSWIIILITNKLKSGKKEVKNGKGKASK
ncbi:MAG: glutaredoxin domain-containing protein [Candidatus Aenigmatarchaeota archaeon]